MQRSSWKILDREGLGQQFQVFLVIRSIVKTQS